MRTYKIFVSGLTANDYIMGRIGGVIYALTGDTKGGYPWERNGRGDWTLMFDATWAQAGAVADCLNSMRTPAYLGMMCIE